MNRQKVSLKIYIIVLSAGLFLFLLLRYAIADAWKQTPSHPVIVIDVGHGGSDPGKIGVDTSLEKNLNLSIAYKLKDYLEASDCTVYLTREDDCSLADANASNQKVSDLKNRVSFILNVDPDVTISIHQNSFSSEKEHGAQTFYYKNSEESKLLAELLQASLIETVDPQNTRAAKSNDSYYILKNATSPIVIIECGFLSNWEEAALLNSEVYQDKLAYAIHNAVIQYCNQIDKKADTIGE